MAASGTTIQVATECCRAAKLDGVEYAEMEPRQPGPVLGDEAVAVMSDDIGHLEGWPVHCFCFFRERLILSGLDDGDGVQRVGHGGQVLLRKMQVHGSVFELGVAQQHLDRTQIGAGFEQVSRKAVATMPHAA